MCGRVDAGQVGLAECRAYRPDQVLGGEGEAGGAAGFAAARVLPVPAVAAGQGDGDQPVDDRRRLRVAPAQPLVAEPGRDAAGAQEGAEGVCLGVADAGGEGQHVGGAPGDAGIAGVVGVGDPVAYVGEGGSRILMRGQPVDAQGPGQSADGGALVVDDLVGPQVSG